MGNTGVSLGEAPREFVTLFRPVGMVHGSSQAGGSPHDVPRRSDLPSSQQCKQYCGWHHQYYAGTNRRPPFQNAGWIPTGLRDAQEGILWRGRWCEEETGVRQISKVWKAVWWLYSRRKRNICRKFRDGGSRL